MIHKVRVKFISGSMVAILLATMILVTAINVVNYILVMKEIQDIAASITTNRYEQNGNHEGEIKEQEYLDLHINATGSGWKKKSKEAIYESRFFSVMLPEDDSDAILDLRRIASVDEDTAKKMAQEVVEGRKTEGMEDGYYYTVQSVTDGTLVIFLNCETKMQAVSTLAWISVCIAAAGICLLFFVIALLSRRAIKPLIENAQKQKRFITDASHELKTPLTAISTNMEILQMDIGESEWIAGTQKQVTNMRRLVNSLISLSRMEEDSVTLHMQKFSFSKMVTDTVEPFEGIADFEGKTFTSKIESDIWVEGDENALRQVVSILCDNAIKYATDSGEIRLQVKKSGKKVFLEVSNPWECPEGTQDLDQFFDRFYRGDASRTHQNGANSYGIGLSIARAIVERHHGRIRAYSQEGRITFEVVLIMKKRED